jgi:hypothetical protein
MSHMVIGHSSCTGSRCEGCHFLGDGTMTAAPTWLMIMSHSGWAVTPQAMALRLLHCRVQGVKLAPACCGTHGVSCRGIVGC